MQFKPVPAPPDDLEAVESVLASVPATAGAIDDCCAHLIAETRLESRSEAESWLVFLRALELVTEEPAGYQRVDAASADDSFDLETLRRAFRERVYGARAVLEALERAAEPYSVNDVFEEIRDEISAFDRGSDSGGLEEHWTERTRRLLEWAVLLGLAERTADGDRVRPATARDEPTG